jgi:hypothetical protein
MFWSKHNQNKPHAGGHSIQFQNILIFLELHNEIVNEKYKGMATYCQYNFLMIKEIEHFSTDTKNQFSYNPVCILAVTLQRATNFPKSKSRLKIPDTRRLHKASSALRKH